MMISLVVLWKGTYAVLLSGVETVYSMYPCAQYRWNCRLASASQLEKLLQQRYRALLYTVEITIYCIEVPHLPRKVLSNGTVLTVRTPSCTTDSLPIRILVYLHFPFHSWLKPCILLQFSSVGRDPHALSSS